MSKFRFVRIDDYHLWDSIIKKSPQYSIFCNSNYLNSIGSKFHLYFLYKGQQVKFAASFILSKDERKSEHDELCIYNSFLFFNNFDQKKVKARQERFDILEYVLEELDKIYDSRNHGFDYQLKIFKINYKMIESLKDNG